MLRNRCLTRCASSIANRLCADSCWSQKYHVWTHTNGDSIVRTTNYSLPVHLHEHVDLVQPTTLFSTFRNMKTTFRLHEDAPAVTDANAPPINVPTASGGHVDASCNQTITVTCLLQLYNAVGYTASANTGNQVGITGYLEQFANIADLQLFFAEQRPDALNSSFKFVSVNGIPIFTSFPP